ncbi:hypothetical protein [Reinekea blandensis]|uniref:Uncharacterized protein n=1 Tax=Reinekea blandensis MED297 TaxID=314283 RepID=A4BH54_9GAMM|nr:hypothetical protein [Reinekea blandensis]EAR08553.1 hypothetical protein MED297_15065 [Reinekea sp. MED297] [Reinekea blandensis MED297]
MNTRFLLFLLIVVAIVALLVIIERNRANPWDSDVFFGQQDSFAPAPTVLVSKTHDEYDQWTGEAALYGLNTQL